jgi:hypothetical protein
LEAPCFGHPSFPSSPSPSWPLNQSCQKAEMVMGMVAVAAMVTEAATLEGPAVAVKETVGAKAAAVPATQAEAAQVSQAAAPAAGRAAVGLEVAWVVWVGVAQVAVRAGLAGVDPAVVRAGLAEAEPVVA